VSELTNQRAICGGVYFIIQSHIRCHILLPDHKTKNKSMEITMLPPVICFACYCLVFWDNPEEYIIIDRFCFERKGKNSLC
jgi:hypothetical protein